MRVTVSIPGVLAESELNVDLDSGEASGSFSIAARDIDGTLTATFYGGLSSTSPEVILAQSVSPISIRQGEANVLQLSEPETEGRSIFDVNRNGLSNLADLRQGFEPAALPPPVRVSPTTIGFQGGLEVGDFTRDFLVLENTTIEPVEVDLSVRLAPGVTVTPLETLFESGGDSAARGLNFVLGPEQERVIAVTFAPANSLFTVGRIALETRLSSNGVLHGASSRLVGNPEGLIPQPPVDYRTPEIPSGGIGGFTGQIEVFPANLLFSRAPLRLVVDESDSGGITTELTRLDAFGMTTTETATIDVDLAYILTVPGRHRFAAALDELTADVDVYAFELSPAFVPSPTLNCIDAPRCSTRLGNSFESVAVDARANTSDSLVLLAFDRVGTSTSEASEVGTVQASLFSVPEFLDSCDTSDPECAPPVSSSQDCPESYGAQICSAVNGGALLTLRGQNFAPGATVTVGSTVAACADVVPEAGIDVIRCTTPPASDTPVVAPTARVTVTNPDGEAATVVNGISYVPPPPTLFAAVPSEGPTTGDTTVWVQASGTFRRGDTLPAAVFAGLVAEVRDFDPGTGSVRVVVPPCQACAGQAVDLTLTNPDGQSDTLSGAFTYRTPTSAAPTLISIIPSTTSAAGGETLAIDGSGFVDGVRVLIGGCTTGAKLGDPSRRDRG
ncbi:MAG: IPT/TIG domain-containing protein [Myxococcota bacterium]